MCLQVAKCHIRVKLKNDSFTELRGEIADPPDTPYEGGNYVLDIKIPETYQFNPPKVSSVVVVSPNVSTQSKNPHKLAPTASHFG